MISDFVFKNIDESIGRGLTKRQSACSFNNESRLLHRPNEKSNGLTRELIKEKLPNLIRKNSEHKFIINQSRPKSPSPISQSKLKTILQHNKRSEIISVVKKSNGCLKNGNFEERTHNNSQTENEAKSGSRFHDNKENNRVNCYQNQRKLEQQKAKKEKEERHMTSSTKSKFRQKLYLKSQQSSINDLYL